MKPKKDEYMRGYGDGFKEGAASGVTEAMVEAASAAYAEETGYYVLFHPGLRSASSNEIRRGIRAALSAALRLREASSHE